MLPPTTSVTAAIANNEDVHVHNLNGGMSGVQPHHFSLTDALRLLMTEVARDEVSSRHARHALDNMRLLPGEAWETGLNAAWSRSPARRACCSTALTFRKNRTTRWF